MSAEKELALVVRGTDWSETSRIVTLFTRGAGKVRALAKGGRRLKSNFDTALDLLTVCHVVYLRKQHGGLDLLTEAQVAERFPALRADLHALYAGYYVAELLADGTQDYDPHPLLFDAALDTLRNLGRVDDTVTRWQGDKGEEQAPPSSVTLSPCHLATVSSFELVWLKELGYSPRLSACAACGRDVSGPAGFSPAAGGVVCPACRPGARDHRPVSAAGLAALRDLADGGGVPAGVRREVRGLLGQTVSYVLGRRPRLLGYVDGG